MPSQQSPLRQSKESFKLKRMLALSILAVLALLPIAAGGQAVPDTSAGPAGQVSTYKYEVFAGMNYTSLNQVNLSRYGLIGGKFGVMRDWSKYFGLAGTFDYDRYAARSSSPGNPGDPSVYAFLLAPELHGENLIGNFGVVLFGELGGEHTGGENMTPSISFAGGFGGGALYSINNHWGLRLTGDRLAGSFSLSNNTPQLQYSTHKTWNPRFSFGAVYKF